MCSSSNMLSFLHPAQYDMEKGKKEHTLSQLLACLAFVMIAASYQECSAHGQCWGCQCRGGSSSLLDDDSSSIGCCQGSSAASCFSEDGSRQFCGQVCSVESNRLGCSRQNHRRHFGQGIASHGYRHKIAGEILLTTVGSGLCSFYVKLESGKQIHAGGVC